jgi:hypothetical protein
MNEVGISLGYNCYPASNGVQLGIRKTKNNGYNTCPFDEMWTNFPGLLQCLNDNFYYFCDPTYLSVTSTIHGPMIYNSKYKFVFNHESPGHADLYISQKWEGGINHFVDNNFEKFIARYNQRIESFRNYLLDKRNFITFILLRYKTSPACLNLLNSAIRKYREINYKILLCDANKEEAKFGLTLSLFDENDEEFIRLNDE